MTTPASWARLGSLLVTKEHAEAAARDGHAVSVFPDGLETLAYTPTFPAKASAAMLRRHESYVGTLPEAGIVNMDANPKLDPSTLRGDLSDIGLYSQMRRTDPVARAICAAWTLPIIRSAWTVEPNGDDRPALELAEWVRANFWEYCRGGWQTFIEQAVSSVWQGFSLFEIVVAFDRDMQKVRLDQLAPMLPRTVYEWGRFEDGRWGVVQEGYSADPDVGHIGPGPGEMRAFPPDKILHFPWDAEGDNPEGLSILRPCYGAWRVRKEYLKLESAGYSRGAFGIPFVEVDPSARVGDSATVNEILRELRTGVRAWAALPPGYTLKFADFPMKGADIREARRAAGMDMARAALAPFLFTGEPGAGGAYALVKGHQDFFQMALQSAAEMVAGVLSDGPHAIVKRLVSWNYPNVESFPYIAPGSISIGDPDKLVTAIKNAADAGVLLPDRGVEEAIRNALGLPEMSDVSTEQWRHETVNASPPDLRSAPDGAPGTKLAETAMNGSQVASALAIVQSAAIGEITRESAIGMISNFFNLPREVAEEIMGGKPSPLSGPSDEEPPVEEPPDDDGAQMRLVLPDSPKATPKEKEQTDEAEERIDEEAEGLEAMAEPRDERAALYGPPTARSGRELRLEETFVRLDETLAPMEGAKEAMARAVVLWREAIIPKYSDRVSRAGDLMSIQAVDVPDVGLLVQALEAELRRVYRAGRMSVKSEVERIESDPAIGEAIADGEFETTRRGVEVDYPEEEAILDDARPAGCGLRYLLALATEDEEIARAATGELAAAGRRKPKLKKPKVAAGGASIADEIDPEDAAAQVARSTGAMAADRVKTATTRAAQAEGIGGVIGREALYDIVGTTVAGLSPGLDLNQAQRDVNTLFGLGRQQQARAFDGEMFGVYSTMMESETCVECLTKDAARFDMSEIDEFATPNPACLGGDKCNCICIYIPQ